jgi:hypothetical protein
MNDVQRARLAALRDRYRERGMDVHGFDGDDNLLHVVVYGRITGAEVAVHTIALDGHIERTSSPTRPHPTTPCTRTNGSGPDPAGATGARAGAAGSR